MPIQKVVAKKYMYSVKFLDNANVIVYRRLKSIFVYIISIPEEQRFAYLKTFLKLSIICLHLKFSISKLDSFQILWHLS